MEGGEKSDAELKREIWRNNVKGCRRGKYEKLQKY